jgi:hypothetical protein
MYTELANDRYAVLRTFSQSTDDETNGYKDSAFYSRDKLQIDFIFGAGVTKGSSSVHDMPRLDLPEILLNTLIFKLNPINDEENNIFNIAILNSKNVEARSGSSNSDYLTAASSAKISVVPLNSSADFRCIISRPFKTVGSAVFNKDTTISTKTVGASSYEYASHANLANVIGKSNYLPEYAGMKLEWAAVASFTPSFTSLSNDFVESPLHQFFRTNFNLN